MEIQFEKLVGNFDRNLDGNFDPWNFGSLEISMQIQFGNLDGNLVWKISWKFRQKFRQNFFILGILDPQKLVCKLTLEIQFGKLVGNLDRNLDGIFYF